MITITNAFSLNMLEFFHGEKFAVICEQVSPHQIAFEAMEKGVVSAVGHADTAAVISSELGVDVPMNRVTMSLKPGDVIYVAQYHGPRLPEGATKLPEGANMVFVKVSIM